MRQPLGQARFRADVPAPVHDAELRVVGRDPDVARHRELHAAREAVAVDRGDDRLPHGDALRDPPEVRPLVGAPAVPLRRALRDPLDVGAQVGPRTERLLALSGENRDVELRVVAEVAPDAPEVVIHLLVETVLVLGVRDRHVREVSLLRVVDPGQLERHGVLPLESWVSSMETLPCPFSDSSG